MKLLDDVFELLRKSVAHADDDVPAAQYCGVCQGRVDWVGSETDGHRPGCAFVAIEKRYRRHQARERARGKR